MVDRWFDDMSYSEADCSCFSLLCTIRIGLLNCVFFFFQAEDGIRDLVRSRGLGDVYKRQTMAAATACSATVARPSNSRTWRRMTSPATRKETSCLLYTSDAADERSSVDLGGRRIIKKKKQIEREPRHTLIEQKARAQL